jgi:hypothetical protein
MSQFYQHLACTRVTARCTHQMCLLCAEIFLQDSASETHALLGIYAIIQFSRILRAPSVHQFRL